MSTDSSSTISITSLQQRIAELEAEVAALKKADSEIWYHWTKYDLYEIIDCSLDSECTEESMLEEIKAMAWEQLAVGSGPDTGMATEFINDEIGFWARDFVV